MYVDKGWTFHSNPVLLTPLLMIFLPMLLSGSSSYALPLSSSSQVTKSLGLVGPWEESVSYAPNWNRDHGVQTGKEDPCYSVGMNQGPQIFMLINTWTPK